MRNRKYLVGVLLLATAVVLNLPIPARKRIKSGTRETVAPFQNVMSSLISALSDLASGAVSAKNVSKEHERMQEEIAMLRLQVRNIQMLKEENRELRRGVGFAERQDHKLLLSQVVVRGDASGWWHTVRLNRGRNAGVRTNMAVITTEGLVGKIIEVTANTSEVLLITDSTCKVASKIVRTGTLGILRGGGVLAGKRDLELLCAAAPFQMDYISRSQKLFEEDEIVTSGLGGVFPEGLLIGRVSEVRVNSSGLYQEARVAAAANLGELRYVFVVLQ